MELLFIDETGDVKQKDYFGLCAASINSAHYKKIKQGFQAILKKSKWDCSIEFKGAYLFSASKGDPSIDIETRVDICSKIIELNTSDRNARMKFYYVSKRDVSDTKKEYLNTLPLLLNKALPKAKSGKGKDICAINCDYRSDLLNDEIMKAVYPVIEKKKYCLYENVAMPTSCFETVGLLYADIIGYLVARIETISNDIELFENITPEQIESNGKLRKLKSSTNLINGIKNLSWYNIEKR